MKLEKIIKDQKMVIRPVENSDIPLFEHCSGGYREVSTIEYLKRVENLLFSHGVDAISIDEKTSTDKSDNDGAECYESDCYKLAVAHVRKTGKATVSGIQRKLRIGYNRAVVIVNEMERNGVISKPDDNGKREVL